MGTNYYWKEECDHCKRTEELHIGKSSGGWAFGLHVDNTITSLDDWKEKFKTGTITNEYDETITTEEMLRIITERKGNVREEDVEEYTLHDAHIDNGLLRCNLRGGHCIGYGDGTWDLIVGEFS